MRKLDDKHLIQQNTYNNYQYILIINLYSNNKNNSTKKGLKFKF